MIFLLAGGGKQEQLKLDKIEINYKKFKIQNVNSVT